MSLTLLWHSERNQIDGKSVTSRHAAPPSFAVSCLCERSGPPSPSTQFYISHILIPPVAEVRPGWLTPPACCYDWGAEAYLHHLADKVNSTYMYDTVREIRWRCRICVPPVPGERSLPEPHWLCRASVPVCIIHEVPCKRTGLTV